MKINICKSNFCVYIDICILTYIEMHICLYI